MGTNEWSVRTVETGQTFTVVAQQGARLIRAEKQTAEQVASFDPNAYWAAGHETKNRQALRAVQS